MDKIFKLLLSAVLLLCCIMLNAQQPAGDGSQANPYQIATSDDLVWFADYVNSGNTTACAKLTADITVNTGVLDSNGNLNGTPSNTWTPIGGQNGKDYSGEFNGDGHTISGLYFNDESVNNIGLFGKAVGNAHIHDLGISDSYFCGNSWVAGICGDFASGRIENCWNGATVISNGNGSCAGGIAGSCWTDASIAGCYNTGKISCTGSSYGGISGVLAKNSNVDASVKDCFTLNTACDAICNDLRDNPVITNSDAKDAVAFASGEVCYQLNNGVTDGSQKWFQTLGSDLLPVLDNSHGTVYYGYDGDVLKYSNSPLTPPNNVAYIDANGVEQTAHNVFIIGNASEQVTWSAGWYVVQGTDIILAKGAVCNGAVHLILADGAKLTAKGGNSKAGIQVSGDGNSLTIYGQAAQSGQLVANGGLSSAGIGGGKEGSGSNITINGGSVTANGGTPSASGIGGGKNGSGSHITINGGTVTANGTSNAAGIGGGSESSGSNITINGGTVTANGGNFGAGIGGGSHDSGSDITINGGTVTANGGENGAGIGGGTFSFGSNVTINNGSVTATGGYNAAGIGGGHSGSGSNININGGDVTANGGHSAEGTLASGIGGGWNASSSDIFVATKFIIRADDNNPPATVVAADRTAETDIADKLAGKRYATVRIPQGGIVTYGEYITVSLEIASGERVAAETEITFTAADRFAENYEFIGFYKESNFENKITQGVSGRTYTVVVFDDDISVYAKYEEFIPTPYIDANGQEQSVKTTEITNETSTLNAGWYVVFGSDVKTKTLTCNGEVHIIIADGAKLTATGEFDKAGIQVSGDGNSLTIYGQAAQSGQLVANGGDHGAGIGSGDHSSVSNITINGGIITAKGGKQSAGIGGGDMGAGSNITINGGIITATGDEYSAGIGGGNMDAGSNITINGGVVTANGGFWAAGIGGGWEGSGFNITINGGTVTATGGDKGTGIGGGKDGSGWDIKVVAALTIYADNTPNPTTEILHADNFDVFGYTSKRYVVVKDVITGIKGPAIAAINAAIEGVTNADIIAIATNAIDAINAATSADMINTIKEQALAAIASAKAILGDMGVPCDDCPSVEVTKGTKTVKLYNPESVRFKKE